MRISRVADGACSHRSWRGQRSPITIMLMAFDQSRTMDAAEERERVDLPERYVVKPGDCAS